MNKKTLAFSVLVLGFAVASPVFAAMEGTVVTPASKIACVGAAVSARETAIDAGLTAYTQAVATAYSARATALTQAYATATSTQAVKVGVKSAWSAFNSSFKSAGSTWRTAKSGAWSAFSSAVKACKAPAGTADASSDTGL